MNGFESYKGIIKAIEPTSLIDVACGRGIYAIEAANLGFSVTATDGRAERVPLKEFKDKGVKFIKCLVEETTFYHEVVLLSGIFYHLDFSQHHELLRKISESKCHTIILNTHIFHESVYADFDGRILSIIDGVGCVYKEGNNRENRPMASITNYYSLWYTNEALKSLFKSYGFGKIETFDTDLQHRKVYKIEKGN